jgi:hypothetical protein
MAGACELVERCWRDGVSGGVKEAEVAARSADLLRNRTARAVAPCQQGRDVDHGKTQCHRARLAHPRRGLKAFSVARPKGAAFHLRSQDCSGFARVVTFRRCRGAGWPDTNSPTNRGILRMNRLLIAAQVRPSATNDHFAAESARSRRPTCTLAHRETRLYKPPLIDRPRP